MFLFYDMVKASTATTGTGSVTTGSAVSPYRAFSGVVANNAQVRYHIADGSAWERGWGVYNSSTDVLTRNLEYSSTGSLLNLSGSATVEIVIGAPDIGRPAMGNLPTQSSTGLSTWANQSNATVEDTPVGMTIYNPSTSSGVISGLKKSASGITSVKALVAVTTVVGAGSYGGGMIGLTDGTKFELFGPSARQTSNAFVTAGRYTDVNTWDSNLFESDINGLNAPVWLRLLLSGGNTSFQWSADGYNFITARSHSTTEFLASASDVVFAVNKPSASGGAYATLMSWEQG